MSTPTTVRAVANFNDGAKVGTVTFQQEVKGGPTKVTINIKGLSSGKKYYAHIHQYGDISSLSATGGYFNPFGADVADGKKHAGDLGEVKVSSDGRGTASDSFKLVSLIGPTSVIGRSIVIHEDEDGNGKNLTKIVAAVIGLTQ